MFVTYIVSSSDRTILDMGSWYYIYIPMTIEEMLVNNLTPSDNFTYAWRITVHKGE